jgi:hypothetical protein
MEKVALLYILIASILAASSPDWSSWSRLPQQTRDLPPK